MLSIEAQEELLQHYRYVLDTSGGSTESFKPTIRPTADALCRTGQYKALGLLTQQNRLPFDVILGMASDHCCLFF